MSKVDLHNEKWFYDQVQKGEIKVYEDGTVTNKKDKKIGWIPKDKKNYCAITKWDKDLNKDRKISIHRLVWITFKGLIEDDTLQVNHLDGNKHNNNLSNLELTTDSENKKHAFKLGLNYVSQLHIEVASKLGTERFRKLSDEQVMQLREEFYSEILTKPELVEKYKLNLVTINKILSRETFTNLPFPHDINKYYELDGRKQTKDRIYKNRRFTDDQIKEMRNEYKTDITVTDMAKKYEITKASMGKILNGSSYKHVK